MVISPRRSVNYNSFFFLCYLDIDSGNRDFIIPDYSSNRNGLFWVL